MKEVERKQGLRTMDKTIEGKFRQRAHDIKNWMKTCSLCSGRFSFKNEGTSMGKITGDFTCGRCVEQFDNPFEALSGIVTSDVLKYIRLDIKAYWDKWGKKNEE
jgi:hypothetical protein